MSAPGFRPAPATAAKKHGFAHQIDAQLQSTRVSPVFTSPQNDPAAGSSAAC